MRYPAEWYQIRAEIGERFPSLRPAQQSGLALWVCGTVLARSGCQNAVVAALSLLGGWDTVRQRLREWLYDGKDKAAPCGTEVDVRACFGALLGWVVSLWQSGQMALAIDVTTHKDRLTALVVSVLYRGSAIPVAWHILPANRKGAWMPRIVAMLELLARAMPQDMQVIVLIDRGLRSQQLWHYICKLGWHPILRVQHNTVFQPLGAGRQSALSLVPGPGHAWVGEGKAFSTHRRHATLLVVWGQGEHNPWVLLTDLAPDAVGPWWYGLRVWIELGFRALKGVGWRWEHGRRVEPTREARHWLVLAVATLWTLAYGTRAEDAQACDTLPAYLHTPPKTRPSAVTSTKRRQMSVFQRGLVWLHRQLQRGQLWHRLWLAPEAWPDPPFPLQVSYHATT